MKNLYIPEVHTNQEIFVETKKLFHRQGMQLNELIADYQVYSSMPKKRIVYTLERKLDYIRNGQEVNLICHGMGCNFGVLLASHPKVKQIVLISPEFKIVSRKEQKQIKEETIPQYQEEVIESIALEYPIKEKLALYRLFLTSRVYASKHLKNISKPIMVVHSNGDFYVSRIGIDDIVSKTGAEKVVIDSSNHNPFMSEQGTQLVKQIRHFLQK